MGPGPLSEPAPSAKARPSLIRCVEKGRKVLVPLDGLAGIEGLLQKPVPETNPGVVSTPFKAIS